MATAGSPYLVLVAAEKERRRRQRMRIEATEMLNAIPEDMTFLQWCQKLAASGMKVDGKPFRLDNRPALVPIYEAIPTTRAEAFRKILVIQKATQLGLTVWEVLANIYMAVKWGPVMGDRRQAVEEAMPGLPPGVLRALDDLRTGETRGGCYSYDGEAGACRDRQLLVDARAPGCVIFVAA